MTLLQAVSSSDSIENITEAFHWFDKVTMKFLSRFLVNFIAVFILVRGIYFTNYRKTELFLTFFSFNIIVFLLTNLLNKTEMSMGAAFGLFAIFSMLRYRTEGISAKDMTYLFMVIALGLITAISKGSWDDLTIMCGILLVFVYILESGIFMKRESTKTMIYDKIDLISPDKKSELLADINQRTGLTVHQVEIQNYDFLKDSVLLTIYYYENKK
ncbi:MAG: DUF4956 domain-containing protein [Leadbetterella sp.]